jgi:hypothetical protein
MGTFNPFGNFGLYSFWEVWPFFVVHLELPRGHVWFKECHGCEQLYPLHAMKMYWEIGGIGQ